MLSLMALKVALIYKILENFKGSKVHFDEVDKSDAPYFYVEMRPHSRNLDGTYSEKSIAVDIQYVPAEDEDGRVDRECLFVVSDQLDRAFSSVLFVADDYAAYSAALDAGKAYRPDAVKDRYITIIDIETNFFNDVLHCEFSLDFADAFTDEELGIVQAELMQTLELNIGATSRNNYAWCKEKPTEEDD